MANMIRKEPPPADVQAVGILKLDKDNTMSDKKEELDDFYIAEVDKALSHLVNKSLLCINNGKTHLEVYSFKDEPTIFLMDLTKIDNHINMSLSREELEQLIACLQEHLKS